MSRPELRKDIEGLRAIAVFVVVAYHLQIPGFGGGLCGVDVFFVISGYLITSLLLVDVERGRGIQLREFYARRSRRILPIATLVILATLVAGWFLQNPLTYVQTTGEDARASAVFYANLKFRAEGLQYIGEAGAESVFRQLWSLSVEEQFYLVWPALLFGLFAITRRDPKSHRKLTGAALVLLIAGSFALALYYSRANRASAFYLPQARAWELGTGALLAVGAPLFARIVSRIREIVAAIGLVMIVVGSCVFQESTYLSQFPYLVPVLGTAFVIAAGIEGADTVGARALSITPMQYLGRYSYSIYLWHWPLVVLIAIPRAFSTASIAIVIAATAVLSVAFFALLEHPVRSSARLRTRPFTSIAMGLALIALAVGASFGIEAAARSRQLDAGKPAAAPHVTGTSPSPTDFVPDDLEPRLVESGNQLDPNAEINVSCQKIGQCRIGDPKATTRVVLFGDSRAGHWAPALADIAKRRGWRFDRITQGGCSSFSPLPPKKGRPNRNCATWLTDRWKELAAEPPSLLILSNYSTPMFDQDRTEWAANVRAALERAPAGTKVAVFSETPEAKADTPRCVSEHLEDVRDCEPPRPSTAINDALRAECLHGGKTFIDLTPIVCTSQRCPAITENLLIYRDNGHLSTRFTESRARDVEALLPP